MSKKSKPLQILKRKDLPDLFKALQEAGYTIIGPTVRDHAILLDEITSDTALPKGISDTQDKHSYKLEQTGTDQLFHFNVGPYSPKKYLFPPEVRMHRITKTTDGFSIEENDTTVEPKAFLGIKPCELHGIAIQDKVFMKGEFTDPHYSRERNNSFTVVTNCTKAAPTCFCTSMEGSPKAKAGFDIALTEVYDKKNHYFLIETGSKKADKILKKLPLTEATEAQLEAADAVIENTTTAINKTFKTKNLPEILYDNLTHKQWDDVADRCLSCGNCTLVCPTCFCSTVEEVTALTGDYSDRVRSWDSCFSREYSYIHGGAVRNTIKARYRQWLTHKLAGWHEQFDTSGCVGCGRCISWCPVGIDLTEEADAIRHDVEQKAKKEEVSV